IGVDAIGTAAIGVVATGAGMAAIGMVATGVAIGTTIITMSFLSVTSAFRGGGDGAGAIRTATDMVMAIRMATVTVTRTGTVMATAMEAINTATTATVMDTAIMATVIAATLEWPSYSAGSLAPVIIAGPLTASWDRRRVEQFAPTSAITDTQADPV